MRIIRATPGKLVLFIHGLQGGESALFGSGPLVNLTPPYFTTGFAFADAAGDTSINELLPPSLAGQSLFFQAVEFPSGRLSNVARVTLP